MDPDVKAGEAAGRASRGHAERRSADGASRPDIIQLESFLPYRLTVLAAHMSRAVARIYEDRWRISIAEWRLIANLARFGPLSAGQVCERAAMDKVRVSRAVAAASRSGLVDRGTDKGDRRRSVLTLTPRGWAIYEDIAPLAREIEESLFADLDEAERAALLSLLTRIQSRAERLVLGRQPAD